VNFQEIQRSEIITVWFEWEMSPEGLCVKKAWLAANGGLGEVTRS
jgi:hypothetical protein